MIPLLGATAVDVTVILALASAAVFMLRRRSAALRHAILAAAFVAALGAPLAERLVPALPLELPWRASPMSVSTLRWAPAPPPQAVALTPSTSPAASLRATDTAIVLWALGAVVIVAGLVTGIVRLALVTRRCRVIDSGRWHDLASDLAARAGLPRPVTLLQSRDTSLLVTWGVWRPRILLPAGADEWSDERREVVLVHELAHIRRHDWAWQMVAEAVRALHWFNPLAWVACRRLRHESEYACDDAVLEAGVEPTDYASHLLEVARHAIGHGAWASVPAIAHPSTLERRISAMLNQARNRTPLTRRAGALAALAAVLVTVPVAGITVTARVEAPLADIARGGDDGLTAPALPVGSGTPARGTAMPAGAVTAAPSPAPAPPLPPPAQQEPATFLGTVFDPSGGVLPAVEMALTDIEVGVRYTAVSDGTGSFTFQDLPPGRYELVARLPGFATVTNVFRLVPGARMERRLTLPLGTLEERIRVACSPGAAAMPPAGVRMVAFGGPGQVSPPGTSTGAVWTRMAPPPAPVFAAQAGDSTAPVRVGGQIKVPRKLTDVHPICPGSVMPAGDTAVHLVATIGVDGFMNEVRLAEARAGAVAPAPEFVESALEAVRQWAFTPTLLNNVAVPVQLTITVVYQPR